MAHSIGMDEPDDDFSNLGVPARSVAEVSGRPRALVYLILTISVFFSWLFLLAMSRRAAEVDPGPGGALLLALPSLKLPDIFEAFFLMCFSPVVVPGGMTAQLIAIFVMWVLMTVAMMLPSAAPMIRTYCEIADTAAGKGEEAVSPLVLLSGYLATWFVVAFGFALLSYALLSAGVRLGEPAGYKVAAAALAVAGLYQFSGLKNACLDKCRNPFATLFARWSVDKRKIFVLGMQQGLWCVGCCWALMLVMFAVGTMNLFWMALIGIFSLVEKEVRGSLFTWIAGGILLVWAAALLVASLA